MITFSHSEIPGDFFKRFLVRAYAHEKWHFTMYPHNTIITGFPSELLNLSMRSLFFLGWGQSMENIIKLKLKHHLCKFCLQY